jgi:hypothetical protein
LSPFNTRTFPHPSSLIPHPSKRTAKRAKNINQYKRLKRNGRLETAGRYFWTPWESR